ncbi:MAG: hypothetical protein LBK82_16855 [Planctomycetaceae bacterium]|nr:hypothetical protein [Planctomycetaceae bacterium]
MKTNLNIRRYVILGLLFVTFTSYNVASSQQILTKTDGKQNSSIVASNTDDEIFKRLEIILNAHEKDLSVLFKSGVDGLKDREIDAYLKAGNQNITEITPELREKTRQEIKNLAVDLLYNYPNSYQNDINKLPEKYKKFVNSDNYTLVDFYKNVETQNIVMISRQYQLFDDIKSLKGKSADVIKEFFVESQLVSRMTGAGIVVGDKNIEPFLLPPEVQKMFVGIEDKICDNAKNQISIYSKGIAEKLNDNIERRKTINQLEGLGYDNNGYFVSVGKEKFHFHINPFDKLQTTALNEKVKHSLPVDGIKKQEVEVTKNEKGLSEQLVQENVNNKNKKALAAYSKDINQTVELFPSSTKIEITSVGIAMKDTYVNGGKPILLEPKYQQAFATNIKTANKLVKATGGKEISQQEYFSIYDPSVLEKLEAKDNTTIDKIIKTGLTAKKKAAGHYEFEYQNQKLELSRGIDNALQNVGKYLANPNLSIEMIDKLSALNVKNNKYANLAAEVSKYVNVGKIPATDSYKLIALALERAGEIKDARTFIQENKMLDIAKCLDNLFGDNFVINDGDHKSINAMVTAIKNNKFICLTHEEATLYNKKKLDNERKSLLNPFYH